MVTSTGSQESIHHLQIAGVYHLVRNVVRGDQVAHGKLDPKIYLKAAAKAGVSTEDCAAFEDSDLGTLAAVRSGAITVQVLDLKQPS